MKKTRTPKVVVIGGGTGTFVALSGLKKHPVDLTAVISMADSGGSNRILRDEFGILPTSDIRQALLALADGNGDNEIFRQLFAYRYHQGTGIAGMTFGNLFMAALTDILGSQLKAIQQTARILHVKGQILPVTLADVQLVARYENGHQVVGEHYIDEPRHSGKLKIVELETIPRARVYPPARQAIQAADLVVIGPGDLYTSLVCNLIIGGVPQALKKTQGQVVFVLNLMSRYGQTHGLTAADHLQILEKYVGRGIVDTVLVNNDLSFPKMILKKYQEEHTFLVKDDLSGSGCKIVRAALLSRQVNQKSQADRLQRSMIRHDPDKLAKALLELIQK